MAASPKLALMDFLEQFEFSMAEKKIVGIVVVRNEDLFIEQGLRSILEFCDDIIVADNMSTDGTFDIIRRLSQLYPKITYRRIKHPRESHTLIQPYVGTPTWIFGLDGDEIYDSLGLKRLREEILNGRYDLWWVVFGNVLNCRELDKKRGIATGYLSPPCRSMTKLYNFSIINAWGGPVEQRLHGGELIFKNNYNASLRLNLHEMVSWENSHYRCLHVCFLKRSSQEFSVWKKTIARRNITETYSFFSPMLLRIIMPFLRGNRAISPWKREKYMRGPLVSKPVSAFLQQAIGCG